MFKTPPVASNPMNYQLPNSLFLFLVCASISDSIIITTSYGKLKGTQIGEFHLFKKIPFAKPPVGNLRFQIPKTVEKWNGVLDATEYGPACMSNTTLTKSPQKWIDEDCLHLNVFSSDKCLKSQDCAVVVCIHGGDVLFGSAIAFNDTYLLNTFVGKDVILVLPAFRLGIFSHFVVENQAISPTNLAFYDILQSLDYVKSEIHHFGGDCKKVTLLGHSFGGSMITMLISSPHVNQDLSLFQRAIIMSSEEQFESLEFQIKKTQRFVEFSNCSVPLETSRRMTKNQQDEHKIKCLQGKTGSELLKIQRSLEDAGYPRYSFVVQRDPLFPKESEFSDSPPKISILTGCTNAEFNDEFGDSEIAGMLDFENVEECENKYRKDLEAAVFDRDNHTDLTLKMILSTGVRVQKLLEKRIPTYLYEFKYPKHALHAQNVYYVLGLHQFEMNENELHLQKVYQNMVTNFAKFGDPGNDFDPTDLENWSYYEVNWDETTGLRPQMRNGFEKKILDYWLREMREYDKEVSSEKNNKSLLEETM